MPGEEDQRHIGAFAVLAEVVERPAHAAKVAVGLKRHLEAEPVEGARDRLGVADGIVERADASVVVLPDHQRNASLRRRRACHDDEGKRDQKASERGHYLACLSSFASILRSAPTI